MDRLLRKEKSTFTTAQRLERLNFAYANVNLDWSNVIFSGKAKFRNVGVWGMMAAFGPWKMRFLNGRYTSEKYVSILEDIILPLRNINEQIVLIQVKI